MPEEKASAKSSAGLVKQLEPYFTKQAPFQIPENGRKLIVEWLPWISLVIGILAIFAFLPLVGIGAFVSTLALSAGVASGGLFWLPALALLAQGVINLVAFPGLKDKKLSAWMLLFWADILFAIYQLLMIIANPILAIGSLVGAAIGLLIGLYILFQIKSHYK